MPLCFPQGLLVRQTGLSVQLVKWGDGLEVLHALKTGWKEQIRSQHCCLFSTPPTWNGDSSVGSTILRFFLPLQTFVFIYYKRQTNRELGGETLSEIPDCQVGCNLHFPAKHFCFSGFFRRNELVCGGCKRFSLCSSHDKVTNAT